jgi:hypothetical protein
VDARFLEPRGGLFAIGSHCALRCVELRQSRVITPTQELAGERWMGEMPLELGSTLGRDGALERGRGPRRRSRRARPCLLVGAADRTGSDGRDRGSLAELGNGGAESFSNVPISHGPRSRKWRAASPSSGAPLTCERPRPWGSGRGRFPILSSPYGER